MTADNCRRADPPEDEEEEEEEEEDDDDEEDDDIGFFVCFMDCDEENMSKRVCVSVRVRGQGRGDESEGSWWSPP